MAELSDYQARELDIDWYCLIRGVPVHIASMGGFIPKRFRETERLRIQQDIVANMEPISGAVLNMWAVRILTRQGYEYLEEDNIRNAIEAANISNPGFAYLSDYKLPIRLFASSFVEKARRGFYSYARLSAEEKYDDRYVLIAKPYDRLLKNKRELRFEPKELNCEVLGGGEILRLGNIIEDGSRKLLYRE